MWTYLFSLLSCLIQRINNHLFGRHHRCPIGPSHKPENLAVKNERIDINAVNLIRRRTLVCVRSCSGSPDSPPSTSYKVYQRSASAAGANASPMASRRLQAVVERLLQSIFLFWVNTTDLGHCPHKFLSVPTLGALLYIITG